MAFNFKTSILPTDDNIFSLGSSTKRWRINDQEITFDTIYPIGAIYMSMNSTNPGTLFGGTWEQITGKFLLACDTTYEAGTTGGSSTVSLQVENLPSHTHSVGAHAHGLNSHTHTGPSHTHTYDKSATTTGSNNNATAGPSNNTSGSTAITVAQMPSHNHGSAGGHEHEIRDGSAANNYAAIVGYDDSSFKRGYGYRVNWDAVTYGNCWWAGYAGDHTHSSNGSGSGHTHTLSSHTHTMSSHTHTITLTSTNSGASGTGNTGAATGNTENSTAFNSGSTGSGTAHNNMPPYLAVYVWQRIA